MQTRSCQLCGRLTKRGTSEHHLVPRACHCNKWFKKRFTTAQMHATVSVCGDCHRAVHRLIPNQKELGRDYNTLYALRNHAELRKFIAWVRKKR